MNPYLTLFDFNDFSNRKTIRKYGLPSLVLAQEKITVSVCQSLIALIRWYELGTVYNTSYPFEPMRDRTSWNWISPTFIVMTPEMSNWTCDNINTLSNPQWGWLCLLLTSFAPEEVQPRVVQVEDVKPIGDWARLGTRNSIRATKESYKWMRCWWRWWMAVGNWKLHIFSPFNPIMSNDNIPCGWIIIIIIIFIFCFFIHTHSPAHMCDPVCGAWIVEEADEEVRGKRNIISLLSGRISRGKSISPLALHWYLGP